MYYMIGGIGIVGLMWAYQYVPLIVFGIVVLVMCKLITQKRE